MNFTLERDSLASIQAHASEAWPEECCGMIIERDGREEVVRVSNIQNELHAEDPRRFPRTAATAYVMGPEAAPYLILSERGELRLLAIYHSHPQRNAYFSRKDRKHAIGRDGEPVYQAAQIVLSVRDRRVRETKAFVWDAAARDYVEAQIRSP